MYFGVFQESAVKNVDFPQTLKRIECNAFYCCQNLKGVRLPDELEVIGNMCFSRSGLEKVSFPAYVKEVGACAFCDCKQLENVKLNNNLEKLGEKRVVNGVTYEGSAFARCAIKNIRFPSSLKRIEVNTCKDCKRLASIEFAPGIEYLGGTCF